VEREGWREYRTPMDSSVDSGTGRPLSWGSLWSAYKLRGQYGGANSEDLGAANVSVVEPVSLHLECCAWLYVQTFCKCSVRGLI